MGTKDAAVALYYDRISIQLMALLSESFLLDYSAGGTPRKIRVKIEIEVVWSNSFRSLMLEIIRYALRQWGWKVGR